MPEQESPTPEVDPASVYDGYEPMDPTLVEQVDEILAEAEELQKKMAERHRELEEQERKKRQAATAAVTAEILELHQRLKRVRGTSGQLERMGVESPLLESLKEKETALEQRIGRLVELLGYDPRAEIERSRRSKETIARLTQRLKEASCPGELRSVANELRQALSFLEIGPAEKLIQQVEEHRYFDRTVEEILSALEAEISLTRREREDPEWAVRRAERERKEEERRRELEELSTKIGDLLQEITDGANYLDNLSRKEVFHQICIWAGRARLYQARKREIAPASNGDSPLIRIFGILTRLSKELQPGHCAALDRSEERDWESFVDQHRTRLVSAQDQIRQEGVARAVQLRREERRKAQEAERKAAGRRALDELRAWLVERDGVVDEEDADEFRTQVVECLRFLPPSHEGLVDLVRPHGELVIQGREFRALRRALGLRVSESESPAVEDTLTDELRQTAAACRLRWQGTRIAIVGGRRRPEVESQLEELLSPDGLRWVEVADGKMGGVGSLEQSVRSGGTQLVLVLVDFVGHNLRKLEETCKAAGVPYRLVGNGCGLRAILEAIPRDPESADPDRGDS